MNMNNCDCVSCCLYKFNLIKINKNKNLNFKNGCSKIRNNYNVIRMRKNKNAILTIDIMMNHIF